MNTTIWLRAETKAMEARSALAPGHARDLIDKGLKVVVEKSSQRAIADEEFQQAGCEMTETGSWPQAPEAAFILGVKDLPEDDFPLCHRHIYFGHAYKEQAGWQRLLKRFVAGGGVLLDTEYLVDDNGRRVAAFGYWAGFTGCAVGLKTWTGQKLDHDPVVSPLSPYRGKDELLVELEIELSIAAELTGEKPTLIIIGAKGRVGSGAIDLAQQLDLEITEWDLEETARGGPFEEILEHDLLINCVLVNQRIPPFITMELLSRPDRKLSVISDVSCDPGEFNPVPVYSSPTTFSAPTLNVVAGPLPVDVTAIDHLPSLLPVEASEDFGGQLLPHLLRLDDKTNGVWQRALGVFQQKTSGL